MYPRGQVKLAFAFGLLTGIGHLIERANGQPHSKGGHLWRILAKSVDNQSIVSRQIEDDLMLDTVQPHHQHSEPWRYAKRFERDFDTTRWRWDYIEEHKSPFHINRHDKTIDDRLANIVATTANSRPDNLDTQRFDLGDGELDAATENLIAGPHVDSHRCGQQLQDILNIVEEMGGILEEHRGGNGTRALADRHLLLAHYLDSFAHYESGQLIGKSHIIGSYKQCIDGQLLLANDTERVPTRHCWAHLKLHRLDDSIRRTMRDWKAQLSVGLCLPESCHSKTFRDASNKDLAQRLLNLQYKLPRSMYIDENLDLDSIFCPPDADSEYRMPAGGHLYLKMVLAWCLLMVMITIVNYFRKNKTSKLLDALDLCSSWKDFWFSDSIVRDNSRVDLNTLSLIKCFSALCVLIGHVYFIVAGRAPGMIKFYSSFESSMLELTISGFTIFTDSFFAMSGLLLTYITLKKINKTPNAAKRTFRPRVFASQWIMFVASRYLRLLPVYYLIYAFKKLVFPYIGSGPLWDYGFNADTRAAYCSQESWLTPLTGRASELPLAKQCLCASWSVAGDLNSSIFVAPIILLLNFRPKLSMTISAFVTVLSMFFMYRAEEYLPLRMRAELGFVRPYNIALMYRNYSPIYTATRFHCHVIFLGVIAGYAVYKYDTKADRTHKWPVWFTSLATIAGIIASMVVFSLLGITVPLKRYGYMIYDDYDVISNYLYMTVGRTVWVMGNLVVFVRLLTDWKDTQIGRLSASPIFQICSKGLFVFVLIQMELIFYVNESQHWVGAYQQQDLWIMFTFSLVVCAIISAIVFVVYENPTKKLIKLMLVARRSERPQDRVTSEKHKQK